MNWKALALITPTVLSLSAVPLLAANNGNGPNVATVSVDCDKGQRISKALERPGDELVVEISGFCNERVEFSRNNVTLIGSNPLTDGITGPALDNVAVDRALVRITDSRGVRIENLTITGSESRGLEGNDGAFLEIFNTRIVENDGRGLQMGLGSIAFVEDSEISNNGQIELITFSGGDIRCTRCTIEDDDGLMVVPLRSSLIVLDESTVSTGGNVAVLAAEAATVLGADTDVTANGIALYASENAQVRWTGGQVDGSIWADFASQVFLSNATQISNPFGNVASESSHIRVDGGALFADTRFTGFSNGTVEGGVTLDTLTCDRGGNAFCDGSETKTGSSCALCP